MKGNRFLAAALAVCLMALVFSGCAATDGASSTTDLFSSPLYSIFMIVIMFAVFYFVISRPEKEKRKKTEEMRANVAVGDKITTIGGIIGRVVHVSADKLTFETGEDRVRIEVAKWAISSNDGKHEEPDQTA